MTQPPNEELRKDMLQRMILARTFADRMQELAAEEGRLPGMQILSTGQEAAAVGSIAALQEQDVIVTNHRSHAHLIARGADPGKLLAEIMGKIDGVNHGKSGTLHMAVPEVNALMTTTVVGATPPLAAGAAFAQHYRGESAVTAVYFGDGAAAEGSVHEAMNLAGVWKLPLLFICENNCWAGAQALDKHCAIGKIAERASSYNMPGDMVDGNDPDRVYTTTAQMVEHCRAGKGPALIETLTYRMRGHGEYDKQHYVDPQELELWRKRDPIAVYSKLLKAEGIADDDLISLMHKTAEEAIEKAVQFADQSPYPPPEDALKHVWVNDPRTGQEV